jgi:hypothetical protein
MTDFLAFLALLVVIVWVTCRGSKRVVYRGPALAKYNNLPAKHPSWRQAFIVLPHRVPELIGFIDFADIPTARYNAMFAASRLANVPVSVVITKSWACNIRVRVV